MRAALLVMTGLLCCLLVPAFAQQGFAPQAASPSPATPLAQGTTALSRDVARRITLDVVVTDKSGKPVPGLQQQRI